ncbi:hypothetical protein B0T16DRAFT_453358 [Cercophora newfieldiana]|uniref:Apple domain-containing protein n=1 Tax=Cercophora newfieldiana TaxID=92897 RepID=A0AA39YSR2_9PEZI|nr:hypothetical protein B0T16DRAFT_453358 [Cercophora newfieldiana]
MFRFFRGLVLAIFLALNSGITGASALLPYTHLEEHDALDIRSPDWQQPGPCTKQEIFEWEAPNKKKFLAGCSKDSAHGIPSTLAPRKGYEHDESKVGQNCTLKPAHASAYTTPGGRKFRMGCFPVTGVPGLARPGSNLAISYQANLRKCIVFCESTPRCVTAFWISVYKAELHRPRRLDESCKADRVDCL